MIIDLLKIRQLNETKVTILKTVTWRCLGTLDTMLISYLLTGKLDIALSIGGIEVVTKMLLYYLHERAWIKLLKR